MNLFEQFSRGYRITGASSTVKQDYRLLKKYFFKFLSERTTLKDLEKLSQNNLNAFYHHIIRKVRNDEISVNYAKECFYAVNKFIKVFNRKYRTDLKPYNVSKFLDSYRV